MALLVSGRKLCHHSPGPGRYRRSSFQLIIATFVLLCNTAAESRINNAVGISGRQYGQILSRRTLAELQRLLFGIVDDPIDTNPGSVVPLPGPARSPPGYIAPAQFNASIFTPPAPVASVQCSPPCLNGGVGQSSPRGCTCVCPESNNTPGSAVFVGQQCEISATICNRFGFYCTHGGVCPAAGTGTCSCPAPYYGTQCDSIGVTCGGVICQNAAKCDSTSPTQPRCSCPAGYSGADCSVFDARAFAAAAQTGAPTSPSTSIIAASTGTTTSTSSGGSSSSGAKWYYILIGVVGGVALCCVVGSAAFLLWRRRSATRAPSSMKQKSLAKQDAAIQMEHVAAESGVREEGPEE